MSSKFREIARALGRPLTIKVMHRPAGIWIFTLALAYSVRAMPMLGLILRGQPLDRRAAMEIVALWVPFVVAAVAIAFRRLIAQVFGGIMMSHLVAICIYRSDFAGLALALVGFAGLLTNRRWFVDRPPNLTK